MRLALKSAFLGLAAVAIALTASAQTRFSHPHGIYSMTFPAGWDQVPNTPYADAFFAPPGGMSKGSIFVGLSNPAAATLDEEIEHANQGVLSSWGRRDITIDGVPCVTQQQRDSNSDQNSLICHITLRTDSGSMTATFFMGSASPFADFGEQSRLFYEVADSISWGAVVER